MSQARRDFVTGIYEFDALVKRLAPPDWELATPCDRWNVTQLVKHLGFAAFMTCGVARGNPAALPSSDTAASSRPAPYGNGYSWAQWLVAFDGSAYAGGPRGALRAWQADRDAVLDALDDCDLAQPTMSLWGHDTIESHVAFAAADPLVHTWDLAVAVGAPLVIEDDVAARGLSCYQAFDTNGELRMPNTLGPIQPVDASHSAIQRLVAFTGRPLNWSAP